MLVKQGDEGREEQHGHEQRQRQREGAQVKEERFHAGQHLGRLVGVCLGASVLEAACHGAGEQVTSVLGAAERLGVYSRPLSHSCCICAKSTVITPFKTTRASMLTKVVALQQHIDNNPVVQLWKNQTNAFVEELVVETW